MKKYNRLFSLCLVAAFAVPVAANANENHKEISGPFATPMDVTKKCLECHEDAARDVMATSHWTWSLEQDVPGQGKVQRGKKDVINNFCISINSNWPRCTSCHVGYGWKDANFDFSDESRVDCLICHDTTGTYVKPPAGAGMPAGFTGKPGMDKQPVDLVKVARNVGKPEREDCLGCHANGGGGNNVKHGDIDQSLIMPTKEIDFHMGTDSLNFTCQECHSGSGHHLRGNALLVSPAGNNPVTCTQCHEEKPHAESLLNNHVDTVSCQACHIPVFAKKDATKMSWDWSQAKKMPKEQAEEKDAHGHAVFLANKGRFVYEEKVVPTYAWYNGSAGAYKLGDKIDPAEVTRLNYPLGDIHDAGAKIHPFKVHTGKQIYDVKNKYFITPKVFGFPGDEDAFWVGFDWNKASAAGMKESGLDYSGEYGFAPTVTYWPINHMVSAKNEAVGCLDCHGDKGRMDWKALGYAGDPMVTKGAGRAKK
ncbi:MAG: cytochrome C [Desulfobulbaceae bacterium DB1]|nr:MAG: cytochrome C [Desulfobulbaceae bacterium DB1]